MNHSKFDFQIPNVPASNKTTQQNSLLIAVDTDQPEQQQKQFVRAHKLRFFVGPFHMTHEARAPAPEQYEDLHDKITRPTTSVAPDSLWSYAFSSSLNIPQLPSLRCYLLEQRGA